MVITLKKKIIKKASKAAKLFNLLKVANYVNIFNDWNENWHLPVSGCNLILSL